jgi:outer membrane protein OmpA-like peptidoglycan-associated protein
VTIARARCAFYGRGDLDEGERLLRDVAETATGGNAALATRLIADCRAYRCDMDGAMGWAFRALDSYVPYRTNTVLVNTAFYYLIQGRPELASRNARLYLDRYPMNWYETPEADPPAGKRYSRDAARTSHRRQRALAWLVVGAQDPSAAIPEVEQGTVREVSDPTRVTGLVPGAGFLNGPSGVFYRLGRLVRATQALLIGERIGLDAAAQAALGAEILTLRNEILGVESPCRATSERMMVWVDGVLVARGLLAAKVADRDRDGIPDVDDKCPDLPEVVNGLDDGDGCPDKTLVEARENQIVLSQKVQFEFDKAVLRPATLPLLDDVARLLAAHPELRRVRIEGHTDSQGKSDYNLDLSRRRAGAVKSYLVSKGLDEARLLTLGFGATRPLVLGNTEAQWAVNRRVEFLVTRAAAGGSEGAPAGGAAPSPDIGAILHEEIEGAEAVAATILAQFATRGIAGIRPHLLSPQELATVDSVTHERYVAKTQAMLETSVEKGMTQVTLEKRSKTPWKGLTFDILQGDIGTYEFRLFKYQGQWKIYRS